MSSLKEALKPKAQKNSSSSKNPTYYNMEKRLFINDMTGNPDEVVRIAAAGSAHIPITFLKQMLETETDSDVLRIILLNERTPLKAVVEFSDDPRATIFDDDEEVTEYLKSRINPDDSSTMEDDQ